MNDPTKTKAVFLTDPLWLPPKCPTDCTTGRRVYCTGDLAYFNRDGTLSFVRRSDSSRQVKLRGLRIDLGEIESAIEAAASATGSSSVRVAVDLVTSSSGMQPFLCAAYCADEQSQKKIQQQPMDVSTIQTTLTQHLPGFMIPHHYIILDHFPVTAVGKRDRNALRVMMESAVQLQSVFSRPTSEEALVPMTEREHFIRDMMFQALGTPLDIRQSIGRFADFFSMGGDSVMAIRLVALLRAKGVELHVVDVFQNATIEKLAIKVEAFRNSEGEANMLLRPSSSTSVSSTTQQPEVLHMVAEQCGVTVDDLEDIYPATAAQELLLDRTAAFSFTVPRLHGSDNGKLRMATEACVARFPILRTRFVRLPPDAVARSDTSPRHTRLMQVVLTTSHAHDQMRVEADLASRIPNERGRPVDSSNYSLLHWFRFDTTTDGEEECCSFVWTISHALYDGWSMNLMIRAIDQYLRSSSPSTTTIIPSCPFSSFVQHEAQARSDVTHISFWKSYLRNLPPPRPQKEKKLFGYTLIADPVRDMSSRHRFAIPPRTTASSDAELDVATRTQLPSTIAMAFLAALVRAVSDALSSTDFLVGYVSSGRSAPLLGIEACVGPTVSLLPLRVQLRDRVHDATTTTTTQVEAQLLEQDAMRLQDELNRVMPYEVSATDYSCVGGSIKDAMSLEVVIQPRHHHHATQDDVVAPHHQAEEFLLQLDNISGVGDASRGCFLLQCSFTDDDDTCGGIITAEWDRRAATQVQVDELVCGAIVAFESICL